MRHSLVITAISLAAFIANLDATIVYISLPTMSREFNVDTSQISWVVLSYLLALCSFLLVFGRLSDMKGSRRIFLWGYLVFITTSFLCGTAQGLGTLIAMRAAQGIGGAMLFSTTNIIIVQYLPEEIRGRAFGMMAVFAGIGIALGSPVGGFLLTHLGWQWIFFVNVPFGIFGLVLAMKVLPPLPTPDQRGLTFDLLGVLLSVVCLSTLVYVLNSGSKLGWLSPAILMSAAVSVVCAVTFVIRERRITQPLVDLGIFRILPLTSALMASFLGIVIFDGFGFVFPFFFDRVKEFSPDKTGMILGITPVVAGLVSPVAGFLVDRLRPRAVCVWSTAAQIIATAIFCTFDAATGYAPIIVSYVLFGAAISGFFTASATLVMSHAPTGKEGITSALLSMFQFSGAIFGVCLFETVYSFRFTARHASTAVLEIPAAEIAIGYRDAAIFGLALGVIAFALMVFLKNKKGPVTVTTA